MPDVAFLLGAPLPRRRLTERRLALAVACSAAVGTLTAGVLLVGLGGVDSGDAVMLVVALAELGALGAAAAWAVERSARWERAAWHMTWPMVGAAMGLAAWAPDVPAILAFTALTVATAVVLRRSLRTARTAPPRGTSVAPKGARARLPRSGSTTYAPRAARWRRPARPMRGRAVAGCGGCTCRPSPGGTPCPRFAPACESWKR